MTPEEISARLTTLTSAINGVDQDVQDLQTLRKNDALIVRAVASDVAQMKGELAELRTEVRGGFNALTAMLQTLIEQDKPGTA